MNIVFIFMSNTFLNVDILNHCGIFIIIISKYFRNGPKIVAASLLSFLPIFFDFSLLFVCKVKIYYLTCSLQKGCPTEKAVRAAPPAQATLSPITPSLMTWLSPCIEWLPILLMQP